MAAFDNTDIKNTSQSTFQLRSGLFLIPIKMRNGNSSIYFLIHYFLFLFFVVLYTCMIELASLCRLKDKYHPTNLLSVIERWVLKYFSL